MKRLQDLDRTSLRILLALYSQLPTEYFRRVCKEIQAELDERESLFSGPMPEGSN